MSVITMSIQSLKRFLASFSDCYEFYSLNIILGIINHLTLHHDESLVQVWIIDWELLPGIKVAAGREFVKVKEEGGEEDAGDERNESEERKRIIETLQVPSNNKTRIQPDCPPGQITHYGEGHVDVSEFLAETETRIMTTTANVQSGESKEGNHGENYEGGLSVEDLQRGFISKVQSGEQREEELGKK